MSGIDEMPPGLNNAQKVAWIREHQPTPTPRVALSNGAVRPVTATAPLSEGDHYFNRGALLVASLADVVRARHPAALTKEGSLALYQEGVYGIDNIAVSATVSRLLGDRFRPGHRSAVEEYIKGRVHDGGIYLPDHLAEPLLNVRNGMLDLVTGVLKPHDPSYLSAAQLPIHWDPDATCPDYEQWLYEMIPEQADDLEETTSTMLDPSRTPSKAIILFGPTRSGKSTFLRLAGAIVGANNMTAVTLQKLSQSRFSAADIYGKILNSAADIPASHVDDLSTFKMMTGEDPINAERKYGHAFTFTNRALFAFSANELPTVGESSRAYLERVKPFEFSRSFAGHEDPEREKVMMEELSGILVRWVRAYQRLCTRGTRLPTAASVQREFEIRSNRVQQWMSEECLIIGPEPPEQLRAVPDWPRAVFPEAELPAWLMTTKRDLARHFNAWMKENGGKPIGERQISSALTSMDGVFVVRSQLDRTRGLNIILQSRADGYIPKP